ncbi:MAG TPA: hypothetical protein DEF59_01950 [Candidatus Magasanikbacteria bacterium]|nr:hypothetical protein [Candidatus Magasanikbacteria bacterium]
MLFSFIKYTTATIFLLVILTINTGIIHSRALGVLFVFIYGWYVSGKLGGELMPGYHGSWQRLTGNLGLLSGVIIAGTILYYFFGLTDAVITVALLAGACIAPCVALAHTWRVKQLVVPVDDTAMVTPRALGTWIGCLIVLVGDFLLLDYLNRHGTAGAIRTPWSIITSNFFILFFLTTFFLIRTLRTHTGKGFTKVALFLHTCVLVSVGYFIYRLGFGFDPFIHRAAESHIAEWEILYPKTPFYIGQYVLVVLLNKLTFLPIGTIDKLLLPILEIIFLPQLVYLALRNAFNFERVRARVGALLFFLVPFASFVTTTPYELAAFLGICVALYSTLYLYTNTLRAMPIILIALAALAVHPLAGIPALLIAACAVMAGYAMRAPQKKHRFYALFPIVLYIISAFAIPLAFTFYLKLQTGAWGEIPSFEILRARLPDFSLPRLREGQMLYSFFTPLYWYYFASPFIFIALAWFGHRVWRARARAAFHNTWFFPIMYIVITTNALLVRFFIRLPGIGDHEQFQYSDRIVHFATYLLVPFFLYGVLESKKYVEKKYTRLGGAVLVPLVCALALTASLYASYPRVDAYTLDKFINTSATDVRTVHTIEDREAAIAAQIAENVEKTQANLALNTSPPYVVLSNISTAAAALQEFGFRRAKNSDRQRRSSPNSINAQNFTRNVQQSAYFKTSEGELYYYSIPTGGPLYLAYLHMAEVSPDRATADYVRALTGASRVYLVINEYWHTFNKITPLAKLSANEWFPIDQGRALVFVYR